MKELLVCYTTVFSVVTQRSLAGRSVQNDFHSFSPFLALHPARGNSQGR